MRDAARKPAVVPVFPQPPHMVHAESGLRVWFIEPLGMLTQMGEKTVMDAAMARFVSGAAFTRLLAMRTREGQPLLFVHDWSRGTDYDSEARVVLVDWGTRVRKDVERIVVVLSPEMPTILHTAVSVSAVGLRAVGVKLDLEPTVEAAIRKHGIAPRRT